jgi:hypothetical protein
MAIDLASLQALRLTEPSHSELGIDGQRQTTPNRLNAAFPYRYYGRRLRRYIARVSERRAISEKPALSNIAGTPVNA